MTVDHSVKVFGPLEILAIILLFSLWSYLAIFFPGTGSVVPATLSLVVSLTLLSILIWVLWSS